MSFHVIIECTECGKVFSTDLNPLDFFVPSNMIKRHEHDNADEEAAATTASPT